MSVLLETGFYELENFLWGERSMKSKGLSLLELLIAFSILIVAMSFVLAAFFAGVGSAHSENYTYQAISNAKLIGAQIVARDDLLTIQSGNIVAADGLINEPDEFVPIDDPPFKELPQESFVNPDMFQRNIRVNLLTTNIGGVTIRTAEVIITIRWKDQTSSNFKNVVYRVYKD